MHKKYKKIAPEEHIKWQRKRKYEDTRIITVNICANIVIIQHKAATECSKCLCVITFHTTILNQLVFNTAPQFDDNQLNQILRGYACDFVWRYLPKSVMLTERRPIWTPTEALISDVSSALYWVWTLVKYPVSQSCPKLHTILTQQLPVSHFIKHYICSWKLIPTCSNRKQFVCSVLCGSLYMGKLTFC